MTEIKPRKNTDYSASAVNLCNPPEVGEVLRCQIARQLTLKQLKQKAEDCVPEGLRNDIKKLEEEVAAENESLKGYIETFGSYQNLDLGIYALKQRAVSKSYNAQAFKDNYAKFVPAVIVEIVNEKALQGLIKGGLLTEAELKTKGITQESESFRFIIR